MTDDPGKIRVVRRTHVVAVAMREEDQVAPLGRHFAVGALRIAAQEGIDVDPFTAGRVHAEGGVSEPGELRGHEENLVQRSRRAADSHTNVSRAQKGSDDAASDAASRIGCTTKNDPIVTTTAAPIATLSAESRGGEPPAGTSRSSVPERMYSHRTTLR